jgi:DMSO/TMAO reductase YedYZ molybdopterin-dependent catalytic subunit
MSEEIEQQVTRRKLFLLVGLAASFAAPVTGLTASNAKAQQSAEQAPKKKKKKAAPAGAAPTPSETPKAQ